jgi:hypothetical protein
MATVAVLGTTDWVTTSGNKTQTQTPTVGDLLVIVCGATASNEGNAAPSFSDNNADGLGTYTKVADGIDDASGSVPRGAIFIRDALITSATSTIFTYVTAAANTGSGFTIFRVTGMSFAGTAALKQASVNNGAATTTPTVTLGAAVLTANAVVGFVLNNSNPAALTAPASWTEAQDEGFASPTTGIQTCYRNSGETSTTVTWGSTSATIWKAAVVELDTSAPTTQPYAGWYGTMGGW